MEYKIFEKFKTIKYRRAVISQSAKLFDRLKKELPDIQKNILLKNHTTFKIGGPADYFLIAENKRDLTRAIKIAKELKLKVFVLGGGSNLLISDSGFKGLVIKVQFAKWFLKTKNIITSESGVEMKNLVEASLKNSLAGLEW